MKRIVGPLQKVFGEGSSFFSFGNEEKKWSEGSQNKAPHGFSARVEKKKMGRIDGFSMLQDADGCECNSLTPSKRS